MGVRERERERIPSLLCERGSFTVSLLVNLSVMFSGVMHKRTQSIGQWKCLMLTLSREISLQLFSKLFTDYYLTADKILTYNLSFMSWRNCAMLLWLFPWGFMFHHATALANRSQSDSSLPAGHCQDIINMQSIAENLNGAQLSTVCFVLSVCWEKR